MYDMDQDTLNLGHRKRKHSNRRSSILKVGKSPTRGALQDLDPNQQKQDGFDLKKSRRASRRVSFAETYQVKEFVKDSSWQFPFDHKDEIDGDGEPENDNVLQGQSGGSNRTIIFNKSSNADSTGAMMDITALETAPILTDNEPSVCIANGKPETNVNTTNLMVESMDITRLTEQLFMPEKQYSADKFEGLYALTDGTDYATIMNTNLNKYAGRQTSPTVSPNKQQHGSEENTSFVLYTGSQQNKPDAPSHDRTRLFQSENTMQMDLTVCHGAIEAQMEDNIPFHFCPVSRDADTVFESTRLSSVGGELLSGINRSQRRKPGQNKTMDPTLGHEAGGMELTECVDDAFMGGSSQGFAGFQKIYNPNATTIFGAENNCEMDLTSCVGGLLNETAHLHPSPMKKIDTRMFLSRLMQDNASSSENTTNCAEMKSSSVESPVIKIDTGSFLRRLMQKPVVADTGGQLEADSPLQKIDTQSFLKRLMSVNSETQQAEANQQDSTKIDSPQEDLVPKNLDLSQVTRRERKRTVSSEDDTACMEFTACIGGVEDIMAGHTSNKQSGSMDYPQLPMSGDSQELHSHSNQVISGDNNTQKQNKDVTRKLKDDDFTAAMDFTTCAGNILEYAAEKTTNNDTRVTQIKPNRSRLLNITRKFDSNESIAGMDLTTCSGAILESVMDRPTATSEQINKKPLDVTRKYDGTEHTAAMEFTTCVGTIFEPGDEGTLKNKKPDGTKSSDVTRMFNTTDDNALMDITSCAGTILESNFSKQGTGKKAVCDIAGQSESMLRNREYAGKKLHNVTRKFDGDASFGARKLKGDMSTNSNYLKADQSRTKKPMSTANHLLATHHFSQNITRRFDSKDNTAAMEFTVCAGGILGDSDEKSVKKTNSDQLKKTQYFEGPETAAATMDFTVCTGGILADLHEKSVNVGEYNQLEKTRHFEGSEITAAAMDFTVCAGGIIKGSDEKPIRSTELNQLEKTRHFEGSEITAAAMDFTVCAGGIIKGSDEKPIRSTESNQLEKTGHFEGSEITAAAMDFTVCAGGIIKDSDEEPIRSTELNQPEKTRHFEGSEITAAAMDFTVCAGGIIKGSDEKPIRNTESNQLEKTRHFEGSEITAAAMDFTACAGGIFADSGDKSVKKGASDLLEKTGQIEDSKATAAGAMDSTICTDGTFTDSGEKSIEKTACNQMDHARHFAGPKITAAMDFTTCAENMSPMDQKESWTDASPVLVVDDEKSVNRSRLEYCKVPSYEDIPGCDIDKSISTIKFKEDEVAETQMLPSDTGGSTVEGRVGHPGMVSSINKTPALDDLPNGDRHGEDNESETEITKGKYGATPFDEQTSLLLSTANVKQPSQNAAVADICEENPVASAILNAEASLLQNICEGRQDNDAMCLDIVDKRDCENRAATEGSDIKVESERAEGANASQELHSGFVVKETSGHQAGPVESQTAKPRGHLDSHEKQTILTSDSTAAMDFTCNTTTSLHNLRARLSMLHTQQETSQYDKTKLLSQAASPNMDRAQSAGSMLASLSSQLLSLKREKTEAYTSESLALGGCTSRDMHKADNINPLTGTEMSKQRDVNSMENALKTESKHKAASLSPMKQNSPSKICHQLLDTSEVHHTKDHSQLDSDDLQPRHGSSSSAGSTEVGIIEEQSLDLIHNSMNGSPEHTAALMESAQLATATDDQDVFLVSGKSQQRAEDESRSFASDNVEVSQAGDKSAGLITERDCGHVRVIAPNSNTSAVMPKDPPDNSDSEMLSASGSASSASSGMVDLSNSDMLPGSHLPPKLTAGSDHSVLGARKTQPHSQSMLSFSQSLLENKLTMGANQSSLSFIDTDQNMLSRIESCMRAYGIKIDDKSLRRSTMKPTQMEPLKTLADHLMVTCLVKPELHIYEWACNWLEEHISKLESSMKEVKNRLPEKLGADEELESKVALLSKACHRQSKRKMKECRRKMIQRNLADLKEEDKALQQSLETLRALDQQADTHLEKLAAVNKKLDERMTELEARPLPSAEQLEQFKSLSLQLTEKQNEFDSKQQEKEELARHITSLLSEIQEAQDEKQRCKRLRSEMCVDTEPRDVLQNFHDKIQRLNMFNVWHLEEWNDKRVALSFLEKTLWLEVKLGPLINLLNSSPDRQVHAVSLISKLGDGTGCWMDLAHRLVVASVDSQALLKQCPNTRHLPTMLAELSYKVFHVEQLARDLQYISILHHVQVDDRKISVEFSSHAAGVKFVLIFDLSAGTYPHEPVKFTYQSEIGNVEDPVREAVSGVVPGSSYFARVVQTVENVLTVKGKDSMAYG